VRSRDAFLAELAVLRSWVGELLDAPDAGELLARPSVLDGWTVADLVAHVAQALRPLTGAQAAERGARPLTTREYVGSYEARAAAIADATRALAVESADDLGALLDARSSAALAALDGLGGDERAVVRVNVGAVRLGDLLVTRLIELVVHGDDLARSLPERPAPEHDRVALRLVVKALLDALAERAPGRTVEVRVPPFAAVQCVEGTSHTRGTPPNVVETDPMTWVRLAAGRTRWADEAEAGRLSVSGTRANLAALLPLL
jgi:uncharacterized protein (TIGR03083 family)